MASAYSEIVKESARVLHSEGLNSKEIIARFKEKTAGLPYVVEPSERTVDGWRAKWRREGIRAGFAVRENEEEHAENAIYRRTLGLHRQCLQTLEDKLMRGETDLALASQVKTLQQIVDSTRAKRRIADKKASGQKLTGEEGGMTGEAAGQDSPINQLERLARAEENPHHQPGNDDPQSNRDVRETDEEASMA